MPIITLLTDFGSKNGFSGVLKGVIWKIAPGVQIADLTHEITPQNVLEGSIALWRAAPYFPPGTIHMAVVDPGVGTLRRPIAAHIADHFFVGPDNGLFTPLLEQAYRLGQPAILIHLDKPQYWLPVVSNTFHGRDIFSPVAAHLASGIDLELLGTPIFDPVKLELPRPIKVQKGWCGQVLLIDHFGNIATNLSGDLIQGEKDLVVTIAGRGIHRLTNTYGEKQAGDLIALIDSENFIEVATVNGNAARTLGVVVGDPVELHFQ
ncbi:MAG: SAM-dependent chlorinase/fluorinase [Anaerolineaceae bacterium]|nr:SAM-dependent chlorinase/fluorinase [Anaerolineaceae bacterium]MBN2678440.1 SAM-dependent chlorinase/fluorinase [Anaerolineaceae bacterium]